MRRQQIASHLAAGLIGGAVVLAAPAGAARAEPAPAEAPSHVFQWNRPATDPDTNVPGRVISSAPAALPKELSALARAKQIRYVTTDVRGEAIAATGLILTPRERRKNKTVAWAHGTTGISDKCAPSANDDVFWPEARAAIAELLKRGWTVAAPDYPGLGTPQPHPYLIGASEGRAVIDSVRAARNLDDDLTRQYVVDGHSQGGQGSLFANQLATAYDRELDLRGTVSIAPTSDARTLAQLIPGSAGQGYMVMALYGLNAVEPSFRPETVLTDEARRRLGVLKTGCLYEVLGAYPATVPLLKGGALPEPWVAKLAHYVDPGQTPLTAPALVVQGTADESVPDFLTDALVKQLKGAPVRYDKLAGETHDGAVFASAKTVANWIEQRF